MAEGRGNPRIFELIEGAPKVNKDPTSPTIWAWPEVVDMLKIAGQPVPDLTFTVPFDLLSGPTVDVPAHGVWIVTAASGAQIAGPPPPVQGIQYTDEPARKPGAKPAPPPAAPEAAAGDEEAGRRRRGRYLS